ncbi:MAG: cysteine-rich CWC family protein [Deltaproteobacteria bacterium]|nr:cysteine-rich CWC family protein [Deltaproteobacteria bacterium]
MNRSSEAQRCPLCEQANACAVAAGREPGSCWCMSAMAAPGVKERLAATPDRCACQRCFTSVAPSEVEAT